MGQGDPVRRQFDVVIERDSEGYYVASVPQLPACHTQARSLDKVTDRIREAIALCLEVSEAPEQELEFVGIQRVTIVA
jgi:predicted RNase H-like HicB family nuclease